MNRQQFVPSQLNRAVAPIMPPAEPEQPQPVNFCAPADEAPKPLTGRQLAKIAAAWLAAMLFSLWLCTSAGMAFMDALWGAK